MLIAGKCLLEILEENFMKIINFKAALTRMSKIQRLGSLGSESLVSVAKSLSRMDAATTLSH